MPTRYHPISCQYYDFLETLAVKRAQVRLFFSDSEGKPTLAEGRISTFFIAEKVEFLQMDNGTEIRLDAILEINGMPLGMVC